MKIEEYIKENDDQNIIFEVRNIFKSIKNKILLDNITFKLTKKSFHVILGHNGAGKSTLFNICTGNDKNYSGDIYFQNEDINLVKIRKSFLSFSTNLSFPIWWNVLEYLKNFSYFFNNKILPTRKIIDKLVEYGLEDKIKSNPNHLSSGEKKKLPIILVELLKPDLVFLDEPDSNLDIDARKFIYQKLKNIANEGSSIFISSHYNNEIKDYADHVTFIKKGRIVSSSHISDFTNNNVTMELLNKESNKDE
ncbi:ABC transporter, ATP-binding protein [Metamycoplasma arthritidis]|uniref:ABC transporter ATP-binding protein n=1 Tax=Metamycoplasma arthritidis (strain 158L3-1) TaxID=243272 RepID=B3PMW5_META1|nr:ABC transporter ATP-binding protein [Metamycoplasma arthritidis]ACF07367.1 ABC transporter ATP-binding protein [Metamycoplasma arthritidis 158L3-1]VEU78886.1 ABC transporter, ATP-binding protein [Metamycoplasma arthritidis]